MTPDGKNGWGNEELQYYTDDPANAQTDGNGNLVITLDEADGSQECYYGPCEFESARLITQDKAGVRLRPDRVAAAGADRRRRAVAGFLEPRHRHHLQPVAGRRRDRRHGVREPHPRTRSSARSTDLATPAEAASATSTTSASGWTSSYHTFTVEWEPEPDHLVRRRHPVPPGHARGCGPNPWVFEKPFFLLLNIAIGGNFGGAIDPQHLSCRRSTWSTTSASTRARTPPSGSRPRSRTTRRSGSRCLSR